MIKVKKFNTIGKTELWIRMHFDYVETLSEI